MLGHNRDVGSSTENRDVSTHYTVKKRVHRILAWKTQIWVKTTTALKLQDITMPDLQWWGTEAMTSCSLSPPPGGYSRGNDLFLSLSLSSSYAQSYITPTLHHYYTKFYLSHIYTNMMFGLFTNIAPMGSQEHIYIYVPSIEGEVLTGPATFGSSHFPSGGTCFLTRSYY